MKVLFDTNVILDVLMDRKPFADSSSLLLSKVETSEIDGLLCSTTITTIYYLLSKALGKEEAKKHIDTLMSLFEIAAVNRIVLEEAVHSKFSDFEDAVLHEAGSHSGAEHIVTRNIQDFKHSKLPVSSPDEMLSLLKSVE